MKCNVCKREGAITRKKNKDVICNACGSVSKIEDYTIEDISLAKIRNRYNFTAKLNNIRYRCNSEKDRKYKYYGGKGIKCLLTIADLKFLWQRDNADTMKQPSVNRFDSDKDYVLDNCQFIEMANNRSSKLKIGIELKYLRCPQCNKRIAHIRMRSGEGICSHCKIVISKEEIEKQRNVM